MEESGIKLFCELRVKDPDNTVVLTKKFESGSYLSNFARVLNYFLGGTNQDMLIGYVSNYDWTYAGTVATMGFAYPIYFYFTSSAGTDDTGIIVGLSSNAVTINDYKLNTRILHGLTANQLQYSAVTFGAPVVSGSSCYFTVTRNFVNGCGSTVTIEEAGLMGAYASSNTISAISWRDYYFLIARDTTGSIAINNGQTLTFNYIVQASL